MEHREYNSDKGKTQNIVTFCASLWCISKINTQSTQNSGFAINIWYIWYQILNIPKHYRQKKMTTICRFPKVLQFFRLNVYWIYMYCLQNKNMFTQSVPFWNEKGGIEPKAEGNKPFEINVSYMLFVWQKYEEQTYIKA